MTDSVKLLCASCGSDQFIQPDNRQLQESDVITCSGCGKKSTVGAIRKQAMEAAKKAIGDQLRKSFKNFR